MDKEIVQKKLFEMHNELGNLFYNQLQQHIPLYTADLKEAAKPFIAAQNGIDKAISLLERNRFFK